MNDVPAPIAWYRLSGEQALERLESDGEAGLSAEQARSRLAELGPNQIAEGKRRQIRRMCEAVGLPVEKLMRIRLGPLKLGKLAVGAYRPLRDEELDKLRAAVGLE